MLLYAIPNLYCPFPAPENTDDTEKAIEKSLNEWVHRFELTKSPEAFHFYQDQRFANMIARSYPLGIETNLSHWANLNTLLFLVDDALDEEDAIKTEKELTAFVDNLIGVLEKERQYSINEHGSTFTALSDFWNEVIPLTSNTWRAKFIKGMRDTFQAGIWQFRHILKQEAPSLIDYLKNRGFLGAANLATDSAELTAQVYLEEAVYNAPAIMELTELCRNTICWANDLYSLSKEMDRSKSGAVFNLVTIIATEKKISIEQAIQETADLHDAEIHRFIEIEKKIYTYDDATNQMVKRYVDSLKYLMRGNIDWSTKTTTRYPHLKK